MQRDVSSAQCMASYIPPTTQAIHVAEGMAIRAAGALLPRREWRLASDEDCKVVADQELHCVPPASPGQRQAWALETATANGTDIPPDELRGRW